MSEGLAQGLYVAARVGFEPTILPTIGVDSTNGPPHPHKHIVLYFIVLYLYLYCIFICKKNVALQNASI